MRFFFLILFSSLFMDCGGNNVSAEDIHETNDLSFPDFQNQNDGMLASDDQSDGKEDVAVQTDLQESQDSGDLYDESSDDLVDLPETKTAASLIIGVEYAAPGMAQAFSELGAPAVKYYPDELSWAKTQPSKDAPMNFDKPDKFVKDYQEVGFSELVMGLKTQGSWAVKDSKDNFAPKPEFLGDYGKWIKAVVERYDMDGDADIVGLKFPVRFFEIGTEFSSFEPEPVEDYITMLEAAYKAAHEASEDAIVMNAAFLTTTAFKNHPAPGEYEESCRRGSGSHAD